MSVALVLARASATFRASGHNDRSFRNPARLRTRVSRHTLRTYGTTRPFEAPSLVGSLLPKLSSFLDPKKGGINQDLEFCFWSSQIVNFLSLSVPIIPFSFTYSRLPLNGQNIHHERNRESGFGFDSPVARSPAIQTNVYIACKVCTRESVYVLSVLWHNTVDSLCSFFCLKK